MLSPPSRRSLERKGNRVHLPCRMPKGNLAARRLPIRPRVLSPAYEGEKRKKYYPWVGPGGGGGGGGGQLEDGLTPLRGGGRVRVSFHPTRELGEPGLRGRSSRRRPHEPDLVNASEGRPNDARFSQDLHNRVPPRYRRPHAP